MRLEQQKEVSLNVFGKKEALSLEKHFKKNFPCSPWSITRKVERPVLSQAIQPVSSVQLFHKDVKIKRPSFVSPHERGERKNVNLFSDRSRKRLLFVSRNSGHLIRSQICLTYHFAMPENGLLVKKQLNQFLTEMRKKYKGIVYLWVLEFQKRGVPHFHLFTSICPSKLNFHRWCAETWNRILGESKEHAIFQGHSENFKKWEMNNGSYIAKNYMAKCDQKTVPSEYHSVGRFWGHSRNMKPEYVEVKPDMQIPDKEFYRIIRIVTKRYEKILSQWVKKKYRAYCTSYSLPSCSNLFNQCLDFYYSGYKARGSFKCYLNQCAVLSIK